jgi:hypothetical protein
LVEGLTVSSREKARADSLGIANYRTHLLSKHSRELIVVLTSSFDYIIDNNLASFACCKYHFYLMMDSYLSLLAPGGSILTHQRGMNWACLDPGFIMEYSDLVALEKCMPIQVGRAADEVYAIRYCKRPKPLLHTFTSYVLCSRDGLKVVEPRVTTAPQPPLAHSPDDSHEQPEVLRSSRRDAPD